MIINTAIHEVHLEWLMGGNPEEIEAQELRGQQQLCSSSQLPKEIEVSRVEKVDAVKEYAKRGIKVRECEDPLFYNVELPAGWRILAMGHVNGADLVNVKGKIIARIFYKAAFYDRRAHIYFMEG